MNKVLERVNARRAEKLPKKKAELKAAGHQIRQKRAVIKRYLSAFEASSLGVESAHERVGEIEHEIALLEERKTLLDSEIRTARIEPVTAEQIRT